MSLTRAKEISKSHRGTRACTLSERSHRAHSSHRVPPRGEGRRRLGLGAAAAGQPHQRLAHARHRLPPHPRSRKEGGVEVVDGVQREEGATVPGRPVEAAAPAARSHARVAALIPRAASSAARREGRGLERPAGRHLPPARRQLGARRRLVARPRSACAREDEAAGARGCWCNGLGRVHPRERGRPLATSLRRTTLVHGLSRVGESAYRGVCSPSSALCRSPTSSLLRPVRRRAAGRPAAGRSARRGG